MVYDIVPVEYRVLSNYAEAKRVSCLLFGSFKSIQ